MQRRNIAIAIVVALLLISTASEAQAEGKSADKLQQEQSDRAAQRFVKNQPIHQYDYSQARENLLAAHDALALGSGSFTVQTIDGIGRYFECPSIGFPLPFGTQITNPLKRLEGHETTLPQIESYGLFPPSDVRATLANCVLPNGKVGNWYSEPDLTTWGFDVEWNEAKKMYEIPAEANASVTVKKVTPEQVNVQEAKE